ncbi:MAG: serC [Conexibacter sp.]|nr:serC [Conexibacter sp.]
MAVSFSAGPTTLPESVLARVRGGLEDWERTGVSILEIGQRTPEFEALAARVERGIRALLGVPPSYAVLLLPGGASQQFAMVPMNLLGGRRRATYLCHGTWSHLAAQEAGRWCEVLDAPAADAAYVHCTVNETIEGIALDALPDADGLPVVGDWSSALFAEPLDVERFGLVYAGAQKSLGAAGLTLVLVRKDLLGEVLPGTPTAFDYRVHVASRSLHATSVPFAWFVADLMLEWMTAEGGVPALAAAARAKAELVYDALDGSSAYVTAEPSAPLRRSRTTITFALREPGRQARFLREARERGLVALEGHASVGGLRAGLYAGMPIEGAERLAAFLWDFGQPQ